jgi:hypothetical protein
VLLVWWVVFVIGYSVVLVQSGADLDSQVVQWRLPLLQFLSSLRSVCFARYALAIPALARRTPLECSLARGQRPIVLDALRQACACQRAGLG